MSKKITIYIVEQATWGADYPANNYFRNKKDVEDFYRSNDYTSKPHSARISAEVLENLKDMGMIY